MRQSLPAARSARRGRDVVLAGKSVEGPDCRPPGCWSHCMSIAPALICRRRKQTVRNHRSSAKQFNPSREVRIEPRRAADGSATRHVAIAPSAMQKLAKAAGVNEVDLSWLHEPLEFMMFELQC